MSERSVLKRHFLKCNHVSFNTKLEPVDGNVKHLIDTLISVCDPAYCDTDSIPVLTPTLITVLFLS